MNQKPQKSTKRTQETINNKSSRLKWTPKALFLLFIAANRPVAANVPLYNIDTNGWITNNQAQDVRCQASTINFYAVWLTQLNTPDPIAFKIDASKLASAKGFIPATGGSKYYLYEAGNDECTHDGLDSKAQNHMIIVVAENDGVTTTGCKVTGIITQKLKPKVGDVFQLFSAPNSLYTLQNAAGGAATTASFGKVVWSGVWDHQIFYTPLRFTFHGLSLAAIDERIVEMMILTPILGLQQPIPPGMADLTETLNTPNKYRTFPGNEFIPEYKPQDAMKRMVHDDLPGYYLDVYNGGASDDVSKILARVLFQNGPGGVQSELYIQKPDQLEVGVTHSIEIKTQQMKEVSTYSNQLAPAQYRIDVTRTASGNINFAVFRGSNTAASLQISHPYTGGQNFIYFNFNSKRGVLYFLNPPSSGCRAKIYETLHVYEVGKTVQRVVAAFEDSMGIAEVTGRDNTNPSISTTMYGTIEYKPPNLVTSNIAVFKVMSFYSIIGVYPNFQIANIDANIPERCYYPLPRPPSSTSTTNKCAAMAHLSGPSENQTLLYADPLSKDIKTASGFLKERCRVTFNDTKCYSTMPGFLVNLNVERDGMPYGGVLTAAEYDALDAKKKGFVTEFTSNLGTRTFVSCPISCGKCSNELKCTECLDGSAVDKGLCPSPCRATISNCGKCDATSIGCAVCANDKLQTDKRSCQAMSTCPAGQGFAAPGLDYECLNCASISRCKKCTTLYDTCEECSNPAQKLISTADKPRLPNASSVTLIGQKDCIDPPSITDYFYSNSANTELLPCKENCKKCSSASDCQECGSYLSPTTLYYPKFNISPTECFAPNSGLEVTENLYSDSRSRVRILFNKKIESRVLTTNVVVEITKKESQEKLETTVTSIELEDNKKGLKIYFDLKSGGVEDAQLAVLFNEKNLISVEGNTSAPFTPSRIDLPEAVSNYRPETQVTASKVVSAATSYTVGVVGAISLAGSSSSLLNMIKTFQMLDFLIYYNVDHPSNLQAFLEYLQLSIIELIPNPFEDYKDKLCGVEREKFNEDGVTCYIISDLGQYLVLTIGIFFYSMLLRLVACCVRGKCLKEHIKRNFGLAFWIDFLESVRFDFFLAVVLTIGKFGSMDGDFLTKFFVNIFFSILLGGIDIANITYQFIDIRRSYKINQKKKKDIGKELGKGQQKDEENPENLFKKTEHKKAIMSERRGWNERKPLKPSLKNINNKLQGEEDSKEDDESTSIFSEDYKKEHFYQRNNRPLMAIKELTIIFMVVALYYQPVLQTFGISAVLTTFLCMDYYYKPYEDHSENKQSLYTGTIFVLINVWLSCLSFTNTIFSRKLNFYLVGYVCIILICLLIAKDLYTTLVGIYDTVKEILKKKEKDKVQDKSGAEIKGLKMGAKVPAMGQNQHQWSHQQTPEPTPQFQVKRFERRLDKEQREVENTKKEKNPQNNIQQPAQEAKWDDFDLGHSDPNQPIQTKDKNQVEVKDAYEGSSKRKIEESERVEDQNNISHMIQNKSHWELPFPNDPENQPKQRTDRSSFDGLVPEIKGVSPSPKQE